MKDARLERKDFKGLFKKTDDQIVPNFHAMANWYT